MTFSHTLRTARLRAGFTQKTLAESCGVSHTYISKLETDDSERPSAELVCQLVKILNIPAWEMFQFTRRPPQAVLDWWMATEDRSALLFSLPATGNRPSTVWNGICRVMRDFLDARR